MRIATAGSRLSKAWKNEDLTWEQFLDRLRSPTRTGETVREYQSMPVEEKAQRKDTNGGFVGGEMRPGRRVKGSVINRWLVTLDADNCAAEDWPRDWDNFSIIQGLRCCVYSTHSHTPDKPRLRWILPLSRAVSPEEYEPIARKVAEWIGIEKMDPLTYEHWRMMFWPSVCKDGRYIFAEADGPLLDPDAVLREYGPDEAWRNEALWPVSSVEGEIVRREIKQQADPRTKPGAIGAFNRVYSVEDAIDAFDLPYERCTGMAGNRYTYTGGTTAAGAVVYNDGLFLYSNHSTDPASHQCCSAFDLVRVHKFGSLDEGKSADDVSKLPSHKAMLEFAGEDENVRRELVESQLGDLGVFDAGASSAPVSSSRGSSSRGSGSNTVNPEDNTVIPATDDTDGEDPDEWKSKLELDKKGNVEPNLNNACLLLANLPAFKGKLGYCNRDKLVYVIGDLPWEYHSSKLSAEEERLIMGPTWMTDEEIYTQKGYHGPPRTMGRAFGSQDRTNLYKYFERWNYSVMQTTNGGLDKAVVDAAQNNPFDPLRDYLIGLRWDGKKRVEDMFIHWLGAEDCELNREITRLWMMGAVDRAMRPGCQFDSVLVFCGEQGIGKTSLLRMLAGEYYTNAVDATSMNKQTAELLQGKWIVELGELDSIKKSSSTAFKNFVTATSDHYRKAYATDAETYPRRCVFAATTNEGVFLRDETGERRMWILPCAGQKGMSEIGKKGTLPGFAEEVEQIWAEAVEMWRRRMQEKRRGGEGFDNINLYLYIQDPELEAQMEERRQGFKLPDTDREFIAEYLDRGRPYDWEDWSEADRVKWINGDYLGPKKVDPDRCIYVPDEITRKEILSELYEEDPKLVAKGGRTSRAIRVTSIMDSMPGWRRAGNAKRKNDRSTLWKRSKS